MTSHASTYNPTIQIFFFAFGDKDGHFDINPTLH